jgi:molybdopterin/thiamine biosynthesis adenylyltransferase
MNSDQSEKYSRQILFPGIGADGQEKILAGSAALVGWDGCGS